MNPKRKSQGTQKKREARGSTGSDYRLLIVLSGAIILAFLMIMVIIFTTPAT